MDIIIREVDEKDYLALLPLWSQFGGYATAENIVPHYKRVENDERYKTFVAFVNDEAVGFITSVLWYGIGVEGSYMMITGIAVSDKFQHNGIGTKLIQQMESYAKEIDVFHIHLNSGFKRISAHTFYEHNGFEKGSYGFGKTINSAR